MKLQPSFWLLLEMLGLLDTYDFPWLCRHYREKARPSAGYRLKVLRMRVPP